MSGGAVSYKSQHDVRKALLDASNESYSLDEEQPMLLTWLCEGTLGDLLSALNSATGTRDFVDPSDSRDSWYAYTTRNRQWKLGAAADASIDASSAHVTGVDGWRVTADAIVNRATATVEEPSSPDWPTLVWQYQLLPPLPVVVKLGTPLAIRVAFADYVVDGPIVTVQLASGSYASVSYDHHGQTGDLVITALAADATVKAMSITGYIVDRAPSSSYTANDTASQTAPRGIRQAPDIGGDLAGPLATARGLADHVVWRYAGMPTRGGMLRPSVTLVNWLPYAFRYDLYDIVSFTSTQLKVSGRLFEIVGIDETCSQATAGGPVMWTTVLQLQECRIQTGAGPTFFKLGTSTLTTGPDVLGY